MSFVERNSKKQNYNQEGILEELFKSPKKFKKKKKQPAKR